MECPKCHKIISDNDITCPHCHKVLSLVCPNCHTLSNNSVCTKCGYIILEKCSKCGKLVSTSKKLCKCGFEVNKSISYNECETDEFACVTVKFQSINKIKRSLNSQELYAKFNVKLINLLMSAIKGLDAVIINYGDTYTINFCKELSLVTSANKAVRVALKILNTFTDLNVNLQNEFGIPLNLVIHISQKLSENLLANKVDTSNIKLLTSSKDNKKYLKGMQIILDQYIRDCIEKDFKTDSLYTAESLDGTLIYYEILLDNYILPPQKKSDEETVQSNSGVAIKNNQSSNIAANSEIKEFKVFDISSKCKFEQSNPLTCFSIFSKKIVTLRSEYKYQVRTSDIINFYTSQGINVVHVVCTPELNQKPWGIFDIIYREYYKLSQYNPLLLKEPANMDLKTFHEFLLGKLPKTSSNEDTRFLFMEMFENFLNSIKDCLILIDGFEDIDDTTIQALSLYFDNFKKVPNVHFMFIIDKSFSVHSRLKGLLRCENYIEITNGYCSIDSLLSTIKENATDFIQSFYFEKIKENYDGSYLYFDNAIRYLTEKGVLLKFDDKLIVNDSNAVVLPSSIQELIRARLKLLVNNIDASMILAYSVFLGPRLDFMLLEKLDVNNIAENAKILQNLGYCYIKNDTVYINNYKIMKPAIELSLKNEVRDFLSKSILSKVGKGLNDIDTAGLMDNISQYKDEYLLLWKNSQKSIISGDYDAYLKNCLRFLALIKKISSNIPPDLLEEHKKEVFQNILSGLYSYSPAKIYSISNVLLLDAIKENNNEKIVKLSNMMLQGALISANYTDALSLLHNILTRMDNPTLVVDGAINTKFLLLSLVNIEILFNIGAFRDCIDTAMDMLNVIKPDIIEKIKPPSFSLNLFVEHMFETFRLVAFAKLITMDDDLLEFFDKIKGAFGENLTGMDCIIAIKDFLAGKDYLPSNIEDASPFDKTIYLILQEFKEHQNDFKTFAQNIYQAKLLSSEIHEFQIERFCDLLIAYSYANIGIEQKAEAIYRDVLNEAENSAIYNLILLSQFLIAKFNQKRGNVDEALLLINDSLSLIQGEDNQAKIFYVLFQKLLVDIIHDYNLDSFDVASEEHKLSLALHKNELSRLVSIGEVTASK